ncbi:MAG TPA: DUF5995 family protein [Chitinophagaceae bacterium]|nr:DUF5995 family protein [Chitinophagaceae bacterium]
MRYFFIILFSILLCKAGKPQDNTYSFYQLYQLDSIGHSISPGSYFGKLYFEFLKLVEKKLSSTDTVTKRLVRNFEIVFARFFIDACIAYKDHQPIPLPAWRNYFTDTTLQPIQYKLLGANAHLNGGLAEAIKGSYTPKEWKQVKKKYIIFNSCLNETYRQVYKEAKQTNSRVRFLNRITLGFDKLLGYYYLYKWRKRQMRLAGHLYNNPSKYQPLLDKINRKKNRIDRLVIKNL